MKRVIFKAFFPLLMVSTICYILGIPKASEGKDPIRLYCLYPPQVELISARGTRVLIDVHDPEALSSPRTKKDVLLTTHNHGDHRNLDFVKSFPGQQLDVKIGEIKMEDVMIRGIAQHSCFGSYVAQVVDLSVNEKTGAIKVHRVVAAVDCGLAVNPNTVKAQIEGSITIALSTALKEEVKFSNGGVKSANFDDYKVIKMSEIPEIEVHIVESKEKMGGIGEPGVPPAAPAVGNAIFNATGARIRRIPFPPERVLEAIKS